MAGRSSLISAACVHWLPGATVNKKDITEKFNNCFISFILILPKQTPSEFLDNLKWQANRKSNDELEVCQTPDISEKLSVLNSNKTNNNIWP